MKSTAIAIQSPFVHAAYSLKNSGNALLHFAYGTQARANATMLFAIALAFAGYYLSTQPILMACVQ